MLSMAGKKFVHLVLVFVVFRESELLVDLLVFFQCVHDGLHTFLHHFQHGFLVIEVRFLLQVAHRVAGAPHHVALIALVDAGDDFHQGGLSRTVEADDAYLGSVEEAQIDVLEHLFLVLLDGLAHAYHREDDLFVVDCWHSLLCIVIGFMK